jgi:preprotein translocase subunit SecG
MKTIASILPYIQIVLAALLGTAILLQKTGAQIGGAFGGSDNFSSAFHTRRGFEKTLFIVTIVIAVLFALTALIGLIK